MPIPLATNIVLSLQLLLPAFNQFAERSGLDTQTPLEESRVTKSYRSKLSSGFMAVFDNRHQFNWDSTQKDKLKGRINYMDLSNSVIRIPHSQFEELGKLQPLISTNEARQIAQQSLKNLGYDVGKVKAGPPIVRQWTYDPAKPGKEVMLLPAFGLRWFPKGKKKPDWSELLLEIEVSGISRRVVYFNSSPNAEAATVIDLRQFMTNRIEKNRLP